MRIDATVSFLVDHEKEYMVDGKQLVKGLLILEKFCPIDKRICAEHDILYLADLTEEMTAEETLQLYRYGFHIEEDVECWAYFT